MANWKYVVNTLPEWEQAQEDKLEIKALITALDGRFQASLPAELYEEIEELFDQLKGLIEDAGDDDVDADEFDEVWSQIYDWADARRIWIKTF